MISSDVAVTIVSHGNRALLLGCVESVLADVTGDLTVQIAVLDNASTDGSAEAVRERFPNVQLLAQTTRAGFGVNHNTLARSTESTYLFLLNDDTLVHRGSISALADFLGDNDSVAVAGPEILTAQGESHTFVLRFPSVRRALRSAVWPWSSLQRWPGVEARKVDWVNGCAMMVRRRAFEDVGGFDESFFMYAEEKDLCARLETAGWETFLVPGAQVLHFGEQSSGAVPARRRSEFQRSQRVYRQKHLGVRGRMLPSLAALGDAQLWLAAAALSRLPARLRPRRLRAEAAAEYRRQLFSVLTLGDRPGLRELAAEWNRDHGTTHAEAPPTRDESSDL